jgi:hypothetical protein
MIASFLTRNDAARNPGRFIYLVNATGTHPLGNTDFAETIWRSAIDLPSDSYESDTTTTL